MCGIAGILSARLEPVAREGAVARMVQRQRHRGPDDDGIASNGNATLGMCRLAIIDPANGHQPMVSPDGRFTLVFNGAIYNYRELQPGLTAHGWTFRTNCDTEVLLAAFALEGAACLRRLRGMFAFAIWDATDRTLFAARDAQGIKPFYYARLPGEGVIFASELNALLAGGQVPREIDPVSVGEYLAWFSVPAPRTIYRGIANLPPGHCLRVDAAGRVKTEAWWQLPAPVSPGRIATNYHDFVHGLRHQLDDTIRAHRIADVPVGAFLSGGMDSTAIVGLMTRHGGPKLKTFSLVFGESGYSEQASARLAAQAFGTDHHEELITGARVAADLPRMLWGSLWLGLVAAFAWWHAPAADPKLLFVTACAWVLLLLQPVDDRLVLSPALRWLGWVGTFSYSLYLVHAPIVSKFRNLLSRHWQPADPGAVWVPVAACGLAVAGAWLFYQLAELRTEAWRKNFLGRRPSPAVTLK